MIIRRARAVGAEFLGTAAIAAAVIGSGRMASGLTRDTAVALLVNQIATLLVLGLAIWTLMPISGAHFNPVVSVIMRVRGSIDSANAVLYVTAQALGAIGGVALANVMYEASALSLSHTSRGGHGQLVGEVVATAGLVCTILVAVDRAASNLLPVLVPAWIGSALFFTSSTAFANPAITIGRVFSDSFAGIAASSVAPFIAAQAAGAFLGVAIAKIFTSHQEEVHVVSQR
jgi:glycerol uptake facilitator-like aquaporin